MPNEKERNRIYAEVEKRRERARQLGVLELILDLYQDIRCYPSWIKDEQYRSEMYPLLTKAIELEEESEEGEKGKVTIVLKGKSYVFNYEENYHDDKMSLELYQEDKKVLALSLTLDNMDKKEYSLSNIEAFREGDWIKDFQGLANFEKGKLEEGMQEIVDGILNPTLPPLLHSPDDLDRLKKDFGLDE